MKISVFDISKIDILGKKAWKFSGNITVHWTNEPRFCDHNGGGKVINMKKSNTFAIKLVNTDDFYLKCTYLAIGPTQNLYFRLKDMIFWQHHHSLNLYSKVC